MAFLGSKVQRSSARQASAAAGKAFREAAQSPAIRGSRRIFVCSGLVAGGYVLLLSMAVLWPSTIPVRDAWLTLTASITQAVSAVVPSVARVSADLAHRGLDTRVPFVSHVIAFEWLIIATHFLISAIILVPERARLAKGFTAAREAYLRVRPDGTGWRKWVLVAVAAAALLWVPFDGESRQTGRHAYDLAASDNGLFIPYLLMIWFWWAIVYYFWLRLLALCAAYDNLPGPARS